MMETDYKSHNVNVLPAMGGNNGWNNNGNFWEALIAWGIIDRNGNRTGEAVTATQVQALATKFDTTSAEMSNRLNALQISTCEQTSTLKDAVHTASTVNLAGQNSLGEKITDIGYMANSNTKDIEKTILVDGNGTRSNNDDNTRYLSNQASLGFTSTDKSICNLGYNMEKGFSATNMSIDKSFCDLKSELKDTKYQLSTQAERNYSALSTQMAMVEKDTIIREKDDQIRTYQDKVQTLEYKDLKEGQSIILKELEEEKSARRRGAELNINSKNIASDVDSMIDSKINTIFTNSVFPLLRDMNTNIVAIGNTVNKGVGNTNK